MHACGHDFHLTAMLGAVLILKRREEKLGKTVKVIFQPAEETVNGALSVLATGVLDDVAEIYGLHTSADLPLGVIGVHKGAAYAAVGSFTVRIRGRGGHAAHPHECRDPVIALCQIVSAAQTVVSRFSDPFKPAVVSFTHVEAGNTWNVIPDAAFMEGTIRALDMEQFDALSRRLGDVCRGIGAALGADIDLACELNAPAVNNDVELSRFVLQKAREAGLEAGDCMPTMGGEDFAEYQKRIRGVFWNIGVGSPAPAHNSRFAANPSALSAAAVLLASLV
jgi:amidohydrolase